MIFYFPSEGDYWDKSISFTLPSLHTPHPHPPPSHTHTHTQLSLSPLSTISDGQQITRAITHVSLPALLDILQYTSGFW